MKNTEFGIFSLFSIQIMKRRHFGVVRLLIRRFVDIQR